MCRSTVELTIGRGDDATVRLDDPTVSRRHARIVLAPDWAGDRGRGLALRRAGRRRDAGGAAPVGRGGARSGSATWCCTCERAAPVVRSAAPVAPGARCERDRGRPDRRDPRRAARGRRHVVRRLDPPAAALGLGAQAGRPTTPDDVRYVLRDLRTNAFLRMDEQDAQLLELLDGRRTIGELLAEATRLLGRGRPGAARAADRRLRRSRDARRDRRDASGGGGAESAAARASSRASGRSSGLESGLSAPTRVGAGFWFSPLAATGLILLSLAGLVTFSYLSARGTERRSSSRTGSCSAASCSSPGASCS